MENQQSEDNEILISTLELKRAWNDVDLMLPEYEMRKFHCKLLTIK